MAEVSIVNYGIGNIGSISNMFRKLRIEAEIIIEPEVDLPTPNG